MDTEIVRSEVIGISEFSTADELADALTKLDTIKHLEKEMRDTLKSRMLLWILANKRDIRIGNKRFYAGVRKENKCRDRAHTLDQMLRAAGGDMSVVADMLCSDPFKAGAARDLLPPEVWSECFEVIEKTKLLDGKVTKEVLEVDERFITDKRNLQEISHEEA